MPKGENFYCRFGSDAVVKVIMYPSKMNASHAFELYIYCARTDCWLGGDELESAFQFGDKSIRRLWTIRYPPFRSLCNSSGRTTNNANRKRGAHARIC